MAITAQQRIARRQYIGSSDASAIMGLDPWRSAADVFLSKTEQLDDVTNDAMDAGNRLESAVLDWAESELAAPFERDVMKVSGPLAANFDGLNVSAEPFIVEAKTTGITGPRDNEYDLQSEDDTGLPARVLIQVHHQFAVAGLDCRIAYVPVLIGGHGFKLYTVQRNEKLVEAVANSGTEFMEHYVRLNIRPEDFRPSLDVLKRIKRTPKKVIDIPSLLVDRWIVEKAAASEAKDRAEKAQAELLAALGDAEAGTYADGGRMITYFEQTRKETIQKACTFRVLRAKDLK